ncbi:MAG: hypothetical protein A2252_03665 [Elusimicrobia bacterium RIFOXYA2_FULL_39_19]|nr:MAG: hypothetical protein A2252_03665 [Elusimicrobia bacterium RIFOXYA2_FULL_39_19]
MKSIMVVEDEELLSQIYEDALKGNYKVIVFKTGKTALQYLENNKPDLAILDVKLPDMSGLKLVTEIRRKYFILPIIMCTAYDTFRSDFDLWTAKISDYLVKPIVLDELKKKIKKILGE